MYSLKFLAASRYAETHLAAIWELQRCQKSTFLPPHHTDLFSVHSGIFSFIFYTFLFSVTHAKLSSQRHQYVTLLHHKESTFWSKHIDFTAKSYRKKYISKVAYTIQAI